MSDSKGKRVARALQGNLGLRKKPQAEIGIADRELSDDELHAVVAAAGSDDIIPSNGISTFGKK